MKKFIVFFWVGLLGMVIVAQTQPAWAAIHAEALEIKQRIESGAILSSDELRRAEEIMHETGQWFDLERAAGRRITPVENGRDPGNPLDEYIWTTTEYEWVDITEIGTPAGIANDDQNVGPFDLGFTFTYYDQSFSSVYMCSNGWISGTTTTAQYTNTALPNAAVPNNIICPFWDDLYPPTGGEFYYYADAANQRFVASWINVPHIGSTTELYTFQVILYSSGNIIYNYQSITETGVYGNLSCTVGIENMAGTEGVQICFNGAGTLPTNETAILVGQPDGVPGPVTNLTGQTVGEDVQLNWTNPSEDTNGNPITLTNVEVWIGVPGNGTLIATLAGTATSYLHANAPDGNLTYYVRAYANPYYGAPANVSLIVGNPSYVEDFDVSDGLWTTAGGWTWGAPTNPNLFGAHSEPNVWAVGLNGDYVGDDCFQLDLDVGLAVASAGATVEFWAAWDSEGGFTPWDGTNFKVSIDQGQNWTVVEPEDGYSFDFSQTDNVCLAPQPVWTGYDSTWRYIVIPIGQFAGQVPIFRFEFGADPIINGGGFSFDDMIIWGLSPPVGAPVSGTITLDGGGGVLPNVSVHANGLGNPQTNPAANGTYTLNNVLVGDRLIWADLAGYHTASTQIVVDEDGVTGVNLTLVRLDPPAPTNLDASVNNDNGLVTLDWDNSTDPLVDSYNIYRKLQDDVDWTLVGNVTVSNATHTLPADGVYLMAVAAVDDDVSTPVESELSNEVTLLYGAIPPTGLGANGNFDDRIRLSWFAPGTPPEFELSYDDGTNEVQGIAWWGGFPTFGWLVAKYQGTGQVSVTRIKVYFTASATIGSTYEVGVFADNGGVPTTEPLGVVNMTQNGPLDDWTEIEINPPVSFPDGIFYIGTRQIDAPVSIGGDNDTPFINSTFYYNFDMTAWVSYEPGLLSVPMQRCFAIGNFGAAVEMQPGVVEITNLPFDMPEIRGTEWAKPIAANKFGTSMKNGASAKTTAEFKPAVPVLDVPERVPTFAQELTYNDLPLLRQRAQSAVMPHAPNATPVSERDPNHSLDDLDYYIVYRGGVDIAHPTVTTYDDVGRTENVDYTYTVAAHYDNGDLSTLAGPVTAHCNMAPAMPTGLNGDPSGQNQMVLTWINPTTNADGTPCVDLAGVRVFRNGAQITQTGPGITQYIDTPPDPQQLYTWTLRAVDEVPNISAESLPFQGFIVSPWEEVDYEWIDIDDVGQNTGLTGDDQTAGPFEIGFDFEYMGQTYSEVWVCSNGWMTFSETFSASYFNEAIPGAFEPNNALFVFWDDMYLPSSGQVLYHSDPANGRFVVTWLEVDHYFQTGEIYTYQCVLTEGGGVYYNYHTIPTGGANGNISCTVGVENSDGSDGIQVCYNGDGAFLPENETAVGFWAGPSGEIAGLVREFSTNLPIQNAQVYVEDGTDTAFTDASGNYLLAIEPGTYTLVIHKQGYCDEVFTNVVVEDNNTTTRNASMRQPNVQFDATSLTMLTTLGVNTSTTFEISNPTTGTICPVEYSISDNAPWLSCDPANGSVPNNGTIEITASANVAGMPVGDHAAVITVTHNDNGSPMEIPVTLSIALSSGDDVSLPTEFTFHQNYPNPFNATTSLRFDLPAESRVDIAIYNVMGQEVARPVSAVYPAGSHSYSFTADNLPSGMYLMRMTAGSFTAMGKMVLLK